MGFCAAPPYIAGMKGLCWQRGWLLHSDAMPRSAVVMAGVSASHMLVSADQRNIAFQFFSCGIQKRVPAKVNRILLHLQTKW